YAGHILEGCGGGAVQRVGRHDVLYLPVTHRGLLGSDFISSHDSTPAEARGRDAFPWTGAFRPGRSGAFGSSGPEWGADLAIGSVRSTARARAARVVTPSVWKMLRR